MQMVSYKAFRDKMRARLWPSPPGEPLNLRSAHNEYFQDGMHELSKTIECLQNNNVTVWPACSLYVQCAKTVTEAPVGMVKRVYTIAHDDWCDRVFYWPTNFREIEAWSRNLMANFVSPTNTGLVALQQGFRFTDATTDIEFGRARIGQWAIWRNRLYIVPWLQSTESLVIEWDGVKQTWNDDDMVDTELWDRHVQAAILAYVQWHHEMFFGTDRQKQKDLKENFENERARALYECKQRIRQQEEEVAIEAIEAEATLDEVEDDEPLVENTEIVFANIGDFCDPANQTVTDTIVALIESWDPDFIITNGDNLYSAGTTYALVDAAFGDFITADLNTNKFWPVIGNHDHTDPPGGIADYYAAFVLPNNERYYDFVKGPVHFFMLHTAVAGNNQDTPYEADGIKVAEKQAEWLRVRLALSTAKWKVVITHEAPYTSGVSNYPGKTYLRWPYGTWGANVVLAGDSHIYERIVVDGLNYLVNGLGGAPKSTINAPVVAGSVFQYATDWGAMKCIASCTELKFEFYSQTGVLIDTLTLT